LKPKNGDLALFAAEVTLYRRASALPDLISEEKTSKGNPIMPDSIKLDAQVAHDFCGL